METFIIESKVTRIETITIQANGKNEAIKKARETRSIFWKTIGEEQRKLISIS